METAYKMFNNNLTCTLGRGKYQYEPGKWYEETEANVRRNGYHVCKNPLDCLTYYHNLDNAQMWRVLIDGDIDEAGNDSALSAQKIKLIKRMSLAEIVAHAIKYICNNKQEKYNRDVTEGPATANANHFAISVSADPRACGQMGDVLGLLRRPEGSRSIIEAAMYVVDGIEIMPGTWYDIAGEEVRDDKES